ncbi:DUF3800 domain-containing protein [Mycoplasma putrefaciens]|uniref:DUF3800 domain-containing protein n=1 Tax=Mycoplasma putrefaciens Mput9231 TaxID=1292033 RepID=M9WH88_9MOLU|nr:DUF3800 domain-containing protein [Mycoplasma putrefaciens]AGJ90754.1 Hypothetical protein MPUT9231_3330 [Mycoplasma putrefaciens Mput9231]
MRRYIHFFIDESGNVKSDFFVVGGFYLQSDDPSEIESAKYKIASNITKTEKSIKKYRFLNEKDLINYYSRNNTSSHNDKEVKWNNMSYQNKNYLIDKLKNNQQHNFVIASNLKKWQADFININAIYNMMVFFSLERILQNLANNHKLQANDQITVKIYIDQRKDIPKVKDKNAKNKMFKLYGLEDYLDTCFYNQTKFKNLNITVNQLNSISSPVIRYCDYFVGCVSSTFSLFNGSKKQWFSNSDYLLDKFVKKIDSRCFSTLKKQQKSMKKVFEIFENYS